MTAFYLFCLIVGGGLLLVSLVGGGSDADVDGVELDADADIPDGAGPDLNDAALHHEAGWDLARDFFSIRSLFYLLAGIGATGLLLESLTDASSTAAALLALLTGLVAAGAAAAIYGYARRAESGQVSAGVEHLVGLPAEVVLPVLAGRRGKIRAVAGGREIELLARLFGEEDADCPRGATVVIVDVDGDTALITPAPILPETV